MKYRSGNFSYHLDMSLTASRLVALLAIADAGSVTRAAANLHTSQPALSRTLRTVERELGVTLFERGPRGVHPTPEGERLLAHARALDAVLTAAGREADALREDRPARLAVGVAPGVPLWPVAEVVARIACGPRSRRRSGRPARREREGTIDVTVVVEPRPSLVELVTSGQLDVAIAPLTGEPQPSIREERLYDERSVVAGRPRHPLSRQATVTLADLATWPWILPPRGTSRRSWVERAFAAEGLEPPRAAVETADIPLQLALVAGSDLLCPFTREQAHAAGPGLLWVAPLATPPEDSQPVGALTASARPPSPGVSRFVDLLKAALAVG